MLCVLIKGDLVYVTNHEKIKCFGYGGPCVQFAAVTMSGFGVCSCFYLFLVMLKS